MAKFKEIFEKTLKEKPGIDLFSLVLEAEKSGFDKEWVLKHLEIMKRDGEILERTDVLYKKIN